MGSPLRILYAATNTIDAPVDLEKLEEQNRAVVTAVSKANRGLGQLSVDDFDCVLSAYELPGQTGVEFLSAIRERDATLPCILFGSDMSEAVTAEAMAADVTDVVDYSVGSSQDELLISRIQAFVRQYRIGKQRDREDDLLEKANQLAGVGVWEYRLDADRSFVSTETLQIYGRSPDDDLQLKQTYQYYHPDDRTDVRDAFQQARDDGRTFDLTARLISDDGTQRWVRLRGELLRINGDIRSIRGIIEDISEQKTLNEKVERQHAKLNELIQVVSHDIRNPLQVGFGQLEHARETGSPEAFDRVHDALERIQGLMDRVVTLSQQGQEPRQVERINLSDLAQTALEAVGEPRITLTTVGNCVVDGDATQLQRLFQRLFENAATNTETDVTVTVGQIQPVLTTTRQKSARSPGFYIEDDGPSLDDDLTDHIFENGYTTTADETGFRLANVAQIADAHDWEMNVSTNAAHGTRFEFVDRSVIGS